MEAPLYNQEGKKVGSLALPEKIFSAPWKTDVVGEVVESMRSTRRSGTAHAKGRGEVRGGGKKPWRQKGTGRARHGSRRSPIWIGGGVTHGPLSEKNYAKKINTKVRRRALSMVLAQKMRDGEVFFVDAIDLTDAKTKIAQSILKKFAEGVGKKELGAKGGRTLFLLASPDNKSIRSFRNLPYVDIEESRNINAEKALIPKYLVFTKEAISKVTA